MKRISGRCAKPTLIIHGGAGPRGSDEKIHARQKAITAIIEQMTPRLTGGASAVDIVCQAVEDLEAEPLFNAGWGSSLQCDGAVKVSASLMDGTQGTFSGVNLATHLIHPIKIAKHLQHKTDRVLGPLGAQLVARELGLPPQNPITIEQAKRWVESLQQTTKLQLGELSGTVGAVCVDQQGRLAAATSTGGRSLEYPDRISDVGSIAGNYATKNAAISCSGIGEHIIDAALSPRLETRVRDGLTIIQASDRCLTEAQQSKHHFGWIGIDNQLNWVVYFSTQSFAWAMIDGAKNQATIFED